ncbi:hypothetical protein HAX54_016008 [Datura stramonium]|uniref:Uncharacterized protein n=1 Tax=Datura stramonium TaxID=4076 RepID=A0ABS8RZS6_DATST|nr:hypothetical protein [Datura stramonium]
MVRFLALRCWLRRFVGADPRIFGWSQLLAVISSALRRWHRWFADAHLRSTSLQPSSKTIGNCDQSGVSPASSGRALVINSISMLFAQFHASLQSSQVPARIKKKVLYPESPKFLFLVEVRDPFLGIETSLRHRLLLLSCPVPRRTPHRAGRVLLRACQRAGTSPAACLPSHGEDGRLAPGLAPDLLCLARPVAPMAWHLALLVAWAWHCTIYLFFL